MVEIRNSQTSLKIDPESISNLCKYVLGQTGFGNSGISICFVEDEEMLKLNKKWFGKNTTTDVISFPMENDVKDGVFLGDIAICIPQALRSSEEYGAPVEEEICLYIIHGILHLLGECDETPKEQKKMEKHQKELLEKALINDFQIVVK